MSYDFCPYTLLKVKLGASEADVLKNYHQFVSKNHPSKVKQNYPNATDKEHELHRAACIKQAAKLVAARDLLLDEQMLQIFLHTKNSKHSYLLAWEAVDMEYQKREAIKQQMEETAFKKSKPSLPLQTAVISQHKGVKNSTILEKNLEQEKRALQNTRPNSQPSFGSSAHINDAANSFQTTNPKSQGQAGNSSRIEMRERRKKMEQLKLEVLIAKKAQENISTKIASQEQLITTSVANYESSLHMLKSLEELKELRDQVLQNRKLLTDGEVQRKSETGHSRFERNLLEGEQNEVKTQKAILESLKVELDKEISQINILQHDADLLELNAERKLHQAANKKLEIAKLWKNLEMSNQSAKDAVVNSQENFEQDKRPLFIEKGVESTSKKNATVQLLESAELNKFKCSECGKLYNNADAFRRHKKEHKRVLKCTFCRKPFLRQDSLARHIKSHHNGGSL